MPTEVEQLRKMLSEAEKLLNEVPLLDHDDRGPKNCRVCRWQTRLQKWHDRLPVTVTEPNSV